MHNYYCNCSCFLCYLLCDSCPYGCCYKDFMIIIIFIILYINVSIYHHITIILTSYHYQYITISPIYHHMTINLLQFHNQFITISPSISHHNTNHHFTINLSPYHQFVSTTTTPQNHH